MHRKPQKELSATEFLLLDGNRSFISVFGGIFFHVQCIASSVMAQSDRPRDKQAFLVGLVTQLMGRLTHLRFSKYSSITTNFPLSKH